MEFLFNVTTVVRKDYTIEADTYEEAKAWLKDNSEDYYDMEKSTREQAIFEITRSPIGSIGVRLEEDAAFFYLHDLKITMDPECIIVTNIELQSPVEHVYESGCDFFYETIGHFIDAVKRVFPKFAAESLYYEIVRSKIMDKIEFE
jgi:hypothetical protein